jgi:hypothetical protein
MKKLVFSLIATVLSSTAFSQGPANSRNTVDYAGVIHNEVLTEFIHQNTTPNMSINEVLKKVQPLVLKNKNYIKRFGSEYTGLTYEQVVENMPDIANNFSTMVNNTRYSSEAKEYLNELLNSLDGATEFARVYESTVALEDRVLASRLSASEKEVVLGASSIARYSSYLWLVENPRPTFSNSLSARTRWWSIVADVAGGILGSGGGVAGTIAGAAGASAVSESISNKP